MNVGKLSREIGIPVATLHYYEEIGLVEPERAENGYRDFGDQQITQLRMLAQARHLGFGLEECRRLLDLNADPARASRDVKALALRNLDTVRSKIGQLQALEGQLETLISQCPGDDDPHCAILNGLNGRSDPLSGEPD